MIEMAPKDTPKNVLSGSEGIHVVAKPIGPACNLNYDYCFYLEKQALFGEGENYRMNESVLSAYITQYIVCAMSVGVTMFLIEEMNKPLGGLVKVSSALLIKAIKYMGK